MPKTLFDKIWEAHEVAPGLLYIDLHLVHEVTSPQAFDGLRLAGRRVRRPDRTLATADHNVPTDGSTVAAQIADHLSRVQVETLERNCEEFGIPVYSIGSARQGIVHVIGPELGVTQPGMTIVCGDSHTSTHGAFGALAFGIGTSEVEHVLATQTLRQHEAKVDARSATRASSASASPPKDLILGTIGQMGVVGGQGYVIEYAGGPIGTLSMEGRMTVCNMTIEGGGRAGMVAPDDTTFEWVEGREAAPAAVPDEWRESDDRRRRRVRQGGGGGRLGALAAGHLGHDARDGRVGDRRGARASRRRPTSARCEYMDLEPGTPIEEIRLDRVFIGSCTNSRIGDLRAAAEVVKGRQVHPERERDGGARLTAGEGAGRGRGPRRGVPRGRLRLAQRGLLDVPRDEPRHPPARRALRVAPRTGTSRAARAEAAAPTSSARRWRQRPPSKATSSTSGVGTGRRWPSP